MAELIARPWLTQAELAQILGITPYQVGDRTRSQEFRDEMWKALDPPEDYLRQISPQALQFLGRQIRQGAPQRLEDGTVTSPTEQQVKNGIKAAETIAKLAIATKHILEGGPTPINVNTKVKGPDYDAEAKAQIADIIAQAKKLKHDKAK